MIQSAVQLGQVCLPTGLRDPRESPDEVFQYVDISAVDRASKAITKVSRMLGRDAPSRARKEIRAGDILVSTVRPDRNAVALVPHELDGQIASTGFCVLRPATELVVNRYLFYSCQRREFIDSLVSQVRGAHYPAVGDGEVAKARVPLPPPSEQHRIVEVLDQADALRVLRADADRRADRFLSTIFLRTFGDPVTNPRGWDTRPLGKLGELDRGRSRHRPRNDPSLLGGPYPFIQTGDVANSKGIIRSYSATYSELGLQQSRLWPHGTLCITIAANIAGTGILAFDACFPDSVVGFRPFEDTASEYVQVLLALLQPVLERLAPQQAQKNINLEILRKLLVPAPPRPQQFTFAGIHRRHFEIREDARIQADRLERLFGALLHRAFSGDLTARWREAHMKELLQEMEEQARILGRPLEAHA